VRWAVLMRRAAVPCGMRCTAQQHAHALVLQHTCARHSPPAPNRRRRSDFTRLTPKVKDIVFVATLKVVLKPLVEEIPGFGEHAPC
jgi:hypothetical protein